MAENGGTTDGLTYNGEPVTSIEFVQRGRGDLDTYRADLVLRRGDETVATVRDLDVEGVQDAIGMHNAMRLNRSADVGEIPQGFIRAHAGRGPMVAPERNVVEPAAVAAVDLDDDERRRRQAIRDDLVARGWSAEQDGTHRLRSGARDVTVRELASGRIATSSNDPAAARAAVEIADAQGHDRIKLSGHADFRREAWIEATSRGIEATGFQPKAQHREAARERAAERVVAARNVVEPGTPGDEAEREASAGRRALERAATIYAAAKTTTVAAAVRLAEHLRPGIEARAPTRSVGRSAVHPQHKPREPEQEIPTP